jgi:hypothetical protein
MNEIEMNEAFFGSLKYFCMFIGYPYSGHSLVGSIIDAHPNAAISHELHVGKLLKKGFSKEQIFPMIVSNAFKFAQQGRTWNNYSYAIPGEWNGRFKQLLVIGDKKGGGSSKFFSKKPEVFDSVGLTIGLPVKYVHVMRNPYDMISTLFRKSQNPKTGDIRIAIEKFIKRIERTDKIKKSINGVDWHDMYHEEVLAKPEETITSLFRFLGLDVPEGFIENCKKVIYPNPHKSRFDVTWTAEDIDFVANELARFDHFSCYSYHS